MNSELLSIVIPNFNGAHFLEPCLDSLLSQTTTIGAIEIIVIDNGSSDGSVELIENRYPTVRIVRNAVNTGFTPAINQGIEHARGSWILLLNNDTELQSGALDTLSTALKNAPDDVAGVQPLLIRASDPSRVDSAGIALEPTFRARDDLHGEPHTLAPSVPTEIWGACAGCVLLRRDVIATCGGFDPDFFAEWDDVDFSLRARWLGFRFLLIPDAIVYHHRSPTSNRTPLPKLLRHRRNQLWTAMKGLPRPMLRAYIVHRIWRDITMIPHYVKLGELLAMLEMWQETLSRRDVMFERRRALMSKATLTSTQMVEQLHQFMKAGTSR